MMRRLRFRKGALRLAPAYLSRARDQRKGLAGLVMLPRLFSLALLTLPAAAMSGQLAPAAPLTTPPEIPFEANADFLQYPPEMNLGEVASVAVDSKGNVFVISRSNATGGLYNEAATQLLEFGPDGRFKREIGHGLYGFGYAHSVRVDSRDRVWVVDKGTNVVVRFDPQWHVDLILGRRTEATDEREPIKRGPQRQYDGYFNQPTDVAWSAAGDIFVSDGYINSRIAKYDRDGAWIKSWGTFGELPGQFRVPHAIVIDRQGQVYVADRTNARIQVFDQQGTYLRSIRINVPLPPGAKPALSPPTQLQALVPEAVAQADPSAGSPAYGPGAPWTLCITNGPTQYIYTSDAFPGRIYKLTLDGRVVGVLGSAGRQPGQFNWLHGMACPSENELYVADVNNWRVQKLDLHPERVATSRK